MRAAVISLAVLLSGCAMGPDAVLPTTPERSEVLAGDYESLASCSYEAIEKTGETGLREADRIQDIEDCARSVRRRLLGAKL